ncbi:hypothetical protein SAMN05428949_1246 [Chitinophaga sp. YR627]|nr:hypothetical protein SAMN05428949_1246 [Chitinophaga sp. YR627]
MKSITILLFILGSVCCNAKCQVHDTLSATVIWKKKLKECILIGVVSSFNTNDTSVIISDRVRKINNKLNQKIKIGEAYVFVIEKDIIVTNLTNKLSVQFKNTIVWTNKESYNLKPRLCLNCINEYIGE